MPHKECLCSKYLLTQGMWDHLENRNWILFNGTKFHDKIWLGFGSYKIVSSNSRGGTNRLKETNWLSCFTIISFVGL